jgi:hypothetical protein
LSVLSQPHSTGRLSPKRYDNRYEVKWEANFWELFFSEVR